MCVKVGKNVERLLYLKKLKDCCYSTAHKELRDHVRITLHLISLMSFRAHALRIRTTTLRRKNEEAAASSASFQDPPCGVAYIYRFISLSFYGHYKILSVIVYS